MDLIRGTILLEVPALITRLGGDPAAYFDAHGIDLPAAGDFDRFVSYRRVAGLIGGASRMLSCPDFGFRLAALQQTRILGPAAVIVRNSETVVAAVRGATRYLHTLAPYDSLELTTRDEAASVSFDTVVTDTQAHAQMVERGLGTMVIAFRLMAGADFLPHRITFAHSRIGPLAAYHAALGCPVDFDRDDNAMHFSSAVLARPIRDRDPVALELAENFLTASGTGESTTEAVGSLVRRLMVVDQVTLTAVAGSLSMHPRALQRRLAEEGTTLGRIHDDVRRDVAWEMSSAGLPAGQITRALGYSEQSTFTRACHRWFGESPKSLRARAGRS